MRGAVFRTGRPAGTRKNMDKDQKQALQVAKEIVVKFIEVGRISPTNFADVFPAIYQEILRTVRESEASAE